MSVRVTENPLILISLNINRHIIPFGNMDDSGIENLSFLCCLNIQHENFSPDEEGTVKHLNFQKLVI